MRLLPFLLLACKGPVTPPVPVPTPPPDPCPDGEICVPERPACDAVPVFGGVVDCAQVDIDSADPASLEARVACCGCDPAMCGTACPPDPNSPAPPPGPAYMPTSCMECHNGAVAGEPPYAGAGISNPHFFGSASRMECTACHGGDGTPGITKELAHVPRPPLLEGDDPRHYVARVAHLGVDRVPDWPADGVIFSGLQWIQFVNPGDVRVVAARRGCGQTGCHGEEHGTWVEMSPMATNTGVYSGLTFGSGLPHATLQTSEAGTAGEHGFRAVSDPEFLFNGGYDGPRVPSLLEIPEPASILGDPVPAALADDLMGGIDAGRVIEDTDLARLVLHAAGAACGDCHLGSQPMAPTTGGFRGGGCSACHMDTRPDGRSASLDPHVPHDEPADPDAPVEPERAHPRSHRIVNVAKQQPFCVVQVGIADTACGTCHAGSNGTFFQSWGLRIDAGRDVAQGHQYPANPVAFADASGDRRLFTGANTTYLGRTADQLVAFEDYDGDGRDDTPPDVHVEAGMGCVDCHGSMDVHAGTEGAPTLGIASHQGAAVGVRCESCHGTIDAPPETMACVDYDGNANECVKDVFGNPMRNVTRVTVGGQAHFRLRSRVTTRTHWVPLVRDLVDAVSNRTHPVTGAPLYSENASFAMGRVDVGPDADGVGPVQVLPGAASIGFSHSDSLECAACHASWTNDCVGCHLTVARDDDPSTMAFSSTTGERVPFVHDEQTVYASPVLRTLTVGPRGRITAGGMGEKLFFRYRDGLGESSPTFAFTDRAGLGGQPSQAGRNPFPALGHDFTAAHSIRGRPTATAEGVMGCAACHLTAEGLAADPDGDDVTNAEDYAAFRALYLEGRDFGAMQTGGMFARLAEIIGSNPGNQLNHPIFVAANAGLGTGLFLFDAEGCPVNPLDASANRPGCAGETPAERFDGNAVVYDLDRAVERSGVENVSTRGVNPAPGLRDGALQPGRTGPLGATLIERLTDPDVGIVLDTWIDADGTMHSP
ncbi:MAG: hypothetical protein H6734_00170 [Alphaproteobacteria bacterium]|nr:hypothetical protein [Alphaproteobacteria bacterium]